MTIHEVLEYSAYELARMADVASPDSLESPGAQFLLTVQSYANDYLRYAEDPGQLQIEDVIDHALVIADSAVPVYTHELFQTLVDLCAYDEPVDDFGTPENIEQAAQWALYMVAERLALALLETLPEEATSHPSVSPTNARIEETGEEE